VRAPPTWRDPVGEGAKRTRGGRSRIFLPEFGKTTSEVEGEGVEGVKVERRRGRVGGVVEVKVEDDLGVRNVEGRRLKERERKDRFNIINIVSVRTLESIWGNLRKGGRCEDRGGRI